MIIQWKNKYSGETGFVKKLNHKKGFFENTFDANEARKFSAKTVDNTLALLNEWCSDNTYEAIENRG